MFKKIFILIIFLSVMFLFISCKSTNEVMFGSYVAEDEARLELYEDGTCIFSRHPAMNYLAIGDYLISDGILFFSSDNEIIFVFKIVDKTSLTLKSTLDTTINVGTEFSFLESATIFENSI